jgi:hypothetical protein
MHGPITRHLLDLIPCSPQYRTTNHHTAPGSREDFYKFNPWQAGLFMLIIIILPYNPHTILQIVREWGSQTKEKSRGQGCSLMQGGAGGKNPRPPCTLLVATLRHRTSAGQFRPTSHCIRMGSDGSCRPSAAPG